MEDGEGAVGEELGAAKAAAEEIGEGGVVLDAGDLPAGDGGRRAPHEITRKAPAVALGGVVGLLGGVEVFGDVPGDGLAEAEGFVVEEAVNGAAKEAHGGFEKDDGTAGGEDAAEFAEGGAGVLEVVPDVKENEAGDGVVGEVEGVGVLDAVKPGVGEEVGGDAIGEDFLDVAHAGAEFDGEAGEVAGEGGGDFVIEGAVDAAEGGLAFPGRAVGMDFVVMLGDVGHGQKEGSGEGW